MNNQKGRKKSKAEKKRLPFRMAGMSLQEYNRHIREIHDWWNYGLNPITGWQDPGRGKPSYGKYANPYQIEKL